MARYTPQNFGGDLSPLNPEFEKIKQAIDDTLSRTGDSPNAMTTPLDMNSERILNLPEPKTANEPARLKDIQAESGLPVQESNAGKYLNTDGSVATWKQVQATDVKDKSSRTVQDTVTKVDALTVATVADAKALDVLVGTVVETQGYNSSGDGGANRYVVVAGGTGTDDGGSFIDMDGSNQLQGLFLGFVSFEQFGVTRDNSDQKQKLQNCLTYAASQKRSITSSVKARCDSQLNIPSETTINFVVDGGIDFSNAPNDSYGLRAEGSILSEQILASDVSVGEETITLAETPNLSEGEAFLLVSEDRWSSMTPKIGEWLVVSSVSGNTITTRDAMRDDYLVSDSAKIIKVDTKKGFKLFGGVYEGAGPASGQIGLGFYLCENIEFHGVKVKRFGIQNIEIEDSLDVFVGDNCNLGEILQATQNSYGITLFNCVQQVRIIGNIFQYCRAGVSSGGRLNSYGYVRDAIVTGNTCTGILGGFVRSHPGADNWVISGNTGTANESTIRDNNEFILFRGRSAIINGNNCDGSDGSMVRVDIQVTNRPCTYKISNNFGRNVGLFGVSVNATEVSSYIVEKLTCQGNDFERVGRSGISIISGSTSTGGVIKSINLSGNSVSDWSVDVSSPAYQVITEGGEINLLNVNANNSSSPAQSARSLIVRCITGSIVGGSISSNVLDNTGSATETMLLIGNGTDDLGGLAINGNYVSGGTYGIRQLDTTIENCLSGNVAGGSAGAYLGFSANEDKGNVAL